MSVSRPLYIGPKLKRLRRELGLTQQAMAEDLDISPSYVALLERNQRPMTADLLIRLARSYKLDMSDFAADEGEDYARRLSDALRDPIFADIELPALEVADLATNFPGISEAFLRLHGAYVREQRALAEQRAEGTMMASGDPIAEARRFVANHRNCFPALDAKAEELALQIAEVGSMAEWITGRSGVRVRFMPPDVLMDQVRRFDRHNQQLLIDETLDAAGRLWQMAIHIAYTAMRSELQKILRSEQFATPTAELLVRRALASYGAAALIMPYGRFAKAVDTYRYDVDLLARHFSVSFEQVLHRLTTLNRPGQERVPFFFIRVDEAGNVSKRLDGAGFPFAAHGGGCPLWSVHSVFRRPDEISTQWLELPDGQRFFSIARMVISTSAGYGKPRIRRAIALACAAEHASKLIYTQGAGQGLTDTQPTLIGVTCRLCHRADCTTRAAPPIGREIVADDYRRGAQPFIFADE